MDSLSGETLVKSDGFPVSAETALARADLVLFYFSAQWCPACRKFTTMLKDFYDEVHESGVEIVFVSSDLSSNDMMSYMKESHGDWLACKHNSGVSNQLKRKYAITGIPTLVICKKDGTVVNVSAFMHRCFCKQPQPNRTNGHTSRLDKIKNKFLEQFQHFYLPRIWNFDSLKTSKSTESKKYFEKDIYPFIASKSISEENNVSQNICELTDQASLLEYNTLKALKKCTSGHSLQFKQNGHNWICDGCHGGTYSGNDEIPKRYRCQPCDYDLCQKCYDKNDEFQFQL